MNRDTGWFKSTHSAGASNNCVEVRIASPVRDVTGMEDDTSWFKSSHSSGGSNMCLEVRMTSANVYLRDSVNPAGPILAFDNSAWRAFLQGRVKFAAD